ncbi:MAG: GGDEF domain-containing protein [Chloroflexota bacterium]|nr:GGDEF domain-containing protein [Chloroflexota bacterium]
MSGGAQPNLSILLSQTEVGTTRPDLLALLPALSLVVAAMTVWGMRLRTATPRRIPSVERPFWNAFATGLALLAIAAIYPQLEKLTGLTIVLPISEVASLLALACWLLALLQLLRSTPYRSAPGLLLDASVVIVAGLVVAERLSGGIGSTAQGIIWQSEKHGGSIAGTGLSWQVLYLCLALSLGASLVLCRFLLASPLPAGQALAIGTMLASLTGGWEWWGSQEPTLATALSRLAVASLSAGAIWAALQRRRPQRRVWSAIEPVLPTAAGVALLLSIAAPVLSIYLGAGATPDAYAFWPSGYWPVSRMIIVSGAFLGPLLVLIRGSMAVFEARRLLVAQSQLTSQNEEYVRLAISDALTRLFNKGYFEYRLKVEWERSRRSKLPITLVALDLDNFKQVNDRLGHVKGDELLAGVGKVIRATVRTIDCPCRVGGDEFIIILPQTDLEGAQSVAERLRLGIVKLLTTLQLATFASVSAGVSSHPATAESIEELLGQADTALYRAKEAGKNQVVLFAPERSSTTPL